jgi:RHS repeat-associated protein
VAALIKASDLATSARFEYGPFGEVIRATGPMAKNNPFRSSTKYQDDETDLLYYGYRYYNASMGRWLSRDPLGELAFFQQYSRFHKASELPDEPPVGFNSYVFIDDNPVNYTDMDGCRMTPDGDVAITPKNRRSPPSRMIPIQVPKCTILFVYGHNFVNNFNKKGLQWIWNIVPGNDKEKQCSYAAVAGCSANLVPNEIPLPGFNYSDYDVGDEGAIRGVTLLQMWDDVKKRFAPPAAEEICKRCDCKEVTLKWQKIGGGIFDLAPKEVKFLCKCETPAKK